jgi:hypothetical protein
MGLSTGKASVVQIRSISAGIGMRSKLLLLSIALVIRRESFELLEFENQAQIHCCFIRNFAAGYLHSILR